jgi:uncharacterized repeat protein (TIGR03803 family)
MPATLTTLVSFNSTNGSGPVACLIAEANGDLFGTTTAGGASGYGTVFEIVNNGTVANPSYATTPMDMVNFSNTGPNSPNSLIVDAKGDVLPEPTSISLPTSWPAGMLSSIIDATVTAIW